MDPITDIVETMKITGAMCLRLEATAPWSLRRHGQNSEPLSTEMNSEGLTDYACLGMVSRGSCYLKIEGESKPTSLGGGDCFLLAPDVSCALSDTPYTVQTTSVEEMINHGRTQSVWSIGGGGASTTITFGLFRFKRAAIMPLSMLLPRLILVREDQTRTLALNSTIQLLNGEMSGQRIGWSVAVTRLTDLLLINMIRA